MRVYVPNRANLIPLWDYYNGKHDGHHNKSSLKPIMIFIVGERGGYCKFRV
jgi:hypothetical protein